MRAVDAEVPDAEVITAANICDEDIDLDELSEETQKRYTADLSFTTEVSPRDTLSELAQCMAGRAVWTQGRWLVRAGAHRTPTLTITADMLAPGAISVVPRASRSELFNAVRARHRNPDEKYAEVQAPLVENSGYEAEDGGVQIVRQIDIPPLADTYRAQRLAKIELERARQALTVRLTTNLAAYDLAPTDTLMLTLVHYGWSAKVFEVIERTLTREATLQYTLRETAAGVWEWNFGEATVGDLAPNTDLPSPYAPPATLTGLTATSQSDLATDGTVILQALLEWDASANAFVRGGGKIDVQWARADRLDQISSYSVPGDSVQATVGPLVGGLAYIARVRQITAVGRAGDWAYVSWVAQSDVTPPEDVANLDWQIKPYQVQITCDPCVARDYAVTELRFLETLPAYDETDWDAATFLVSGKSNEYHHPRPPNGTYYVLAKHQDTTGNYSETPAYITVVVDDSIETGGGGTLRLTTDRFPFFSFSSGTTHTAQAPGDTPITFTALLFGLFGTASWTAEAFDNRIGGASLGAVTLSGSGNERTMSAAQFVAPGISGSVERVRVTATLSSATDFIDVYRQDPTTTAPFLFLSNPQHQVPTDESGEFGDYSEAETAAVVYEGITDTTADWDFAITPDSGVTATINGGAGPVANPATVTVAVSAMTIPTGVVLLTASQTGEADLTADFIVDKQEASGSGYVFYFTPRTEIILEVTEAGEVTTYENAWSELKIIKGGTLDDTANWDLSKEDVNVTSTLTGALVEVTEFLGLGEVGTLQTIALPMTGSGWSTVNVIRYADGVWIATGQGIGTWSVVMRSTDFETWTQVNVGAAGKWAASAFDQGAWIVVQIGAATDKIRRSTDGGLTWAQVTLPASNTWAGVSVGGGRIIIWTAGTGAYQSTDGGASWSSLTMPATGIAALWYGAGYWLTFTGSSVTYISTNGGASWTNDSANWPSVAFDAIAYKGRLVATRTGTSAFYRESGGPWVAATLPASMSNGRLVIVSDTLYMLDAASKMLYTTDGRTWYQGENVTTHQQVKADNSIPVDFIPLHTAFGTNVHKMPLDATSGTEGAVHVTATKPGAFDIEAVLPVRKGTAAKVNYALSARPASISLPATADGVVTDFSNASFQFYAQKDGVDDTANWTWTWTATNLTPASGSGSTATFTAMSSSQDQGLVTVTFAKPGEVQHQETLVVSKVKGSDRSGPVPDVVFRAVSETTTYVAMRFATNGKVQIKRASGDPWSDYTNWSGFIGTQPVTYYLKLIPDAAYHALTSGPSGSYVALTSDRDFVLSDAASGTHRVPFDVFIATDASGTGAVWGQGELRLVVP
jgi:hypothetical protein